MACRRGPEGATRHRRVQTSPRTSRLDTRTAFQLLGNGAGPKHIAAVTGQQVPGTAAEAIAPAGPDGAHRTAMPGRDEPHGADRRRRQCSGSVASMLLRLSGYARIPARKVLEAVAAAVRERPDIICSMSACRVSTGWRPAGVSDACPRAVARAFFRRCPALRRPGHGRTRLAPGCRDQGRPIGRHLPQWSDPPVWSSIEMDGGPGLPLRRCRRPQRDASLNGDQRQTEDGAGSYP